MEMTAITIQFDMVRRSAFQEHIGDWYLQDKPVFGVGEVLFCRELGSEDGRFFAKIKVTGIFPPESPGQVGYTHPDKCWWHITYTLLEFKP